MAEGEVNIKTGEEIAESHSEDKPFSLIKTSGMYHSMKEFLPEETGEISRLDQIKNDFPEIEDLSSDETQGIIDYLNTNEKFNEEKYKALGINEELDAKLKEVYPDHFKVGEESSEEDPELFTKLEDMEKPDLIVEVKDKVNLLSQKDTAIKELEEKIQELEKNTPGEESEVLQDMKSLSKDFKGNYSRLQKKYNLPDLDLVKAQLDGGDIGSRLEQYQNNELRAKIEEQFKLAEGEFEYDPKEAAKARTASWYWDYYSKEKENQLKQEMESLTSSSQAQIEKVEAQQQEDINWLAENYFDKDLNKAKEKITELNEIANKVSSGELTPDKYPLALRNIVRGAFYDEFVTAEKKIALDNLVKQFAEKGMYLPDDELPTDVTKPSSSPTNHDINKKDIEKKKISPMLRSFDIDIN